MFYGETEIQELVICPCCVNKYDDPRLIECGSSFCMPCIEFLANEESNGFKCPVCDEFHEQPKKGYLKNTTLAKLCEKKANKVSRGVIAKAFETELDELKLNMNKLAKVNELGGDKIEEFYEDLRNEVQLHLKELIASLKKQSLELIHKIDEHENEAMFKFNTNYKLRSNRFLSTAHKFNQNNSSIYAFSIISRFLRIHLFSTNPAFFTFSAFSTKNSKSLGAGKDYRLKIGPTT